MSQTPTAEDQRVAALHRYHIVNTLPEKQFDELAMFAAKIADVPNTVISFIDENKLWFKSHLGLNINQTDKSDSFCHHMIGSNQASVIEDLRKDDRFMNNPFVTGDPHFVYFAGVPLVTSDKYVIGALNVLHTKEHKLESHQLQSLEVIAKQIINLLELQKKQLEIKALKDMLDHKKVELEQFAHVVSHDIKTPVSNILLSTQLLTEDYASELDGTANNLLDILKRASQKIKDLVDGVLSYYRSDAALAQHAEEIQLKGFFYAVTDLLAHHNDASIHYPKDDIYIHARRTALEQIFSNLLNNAIKYNDNEKADISISFKEEAEFYAFTVTDNGRGIAEKDYDKIFALFTNLGFKDRFGNSGTGIGLSIVKKLVESQGGSIALHSSEGKGTTVEFTIRKETELS